MSQQRSECFVASISSTIILAIGFVAGLAGAAAGQSSLDAGRVGLGFVQLGLALVIVLALVLYHYTPRTALGRKILLWCVVLLSLIAIVYGTSRIPAVPFLYLLPFMLFFLGGIRVGSTVLGVFVLALLVSVGRPDLIIWARPGEGYYNFALVVTFLLISGLSALILFFWNQSAGMIHYLATTDTETRLPIRSEYLQVPSIPQGNGALVAIRNLAEVESSLGFRVASLLRRHLAESILARLDPPWRVFQFSDASYIVTATSNEPQGLAITEVARILQSSLTIPLMLDERMIQPALDIAVVNAGEPLQPEELARRLETARQLVSRTDSTSIALYDPILDTRRQERFRMGTLLADALQKRELYLAYQPIVDALDREILAVEVLLRWTSAELGHVAPTGFIPLAEERGLIGEITEWIITTAWQEVQAVRPGTIISVNISPVHLRDPNFLNRLGEILEANGIDPGQLILEITEGVLVDEDIARRGVIPAMATLGASLAIDDFGTGYSNVEYLQRFPVNRLKIDRSFVAELFDPMGNLNSRSAPVLEAMIFMGRSLGMTVICEGVEDEQTARWLHAAGCDAFQGYLFGRPRDLQALLKRRAADGA